MIRAKIDIMQALSDKGYNTTRIRKEGMFGESILTKIRTNDITGLSLRTVNTLCGLLKKQPGQLLEYIPDNLPTDQEEK